MNKSAGFWAQSIDDQTSLLPWPVARTEKWEDQDDFIVRLETLEKSLRERGEDSYVGYRGYSFCRCCENRRNGSHTYVHDGWIWPEGYIHYLRDHNVQPDKDFKLFIMELPC